MASILDRYGIKEVADVTFYKINSDGTMGDPVLYLDTLKVSTIEQTAETSEARGGKGNPVLISWDYGKEINVSLEDALFSPKSMAIMLGNGVAGEKATYTVTRTYVARVIENGDSDYIDYITADIYDSVNGSARQKIDMQNSTARAGMKAYAGSGLSISKITKEDGSQITISAGAALTAIQNAIKGANVGGQKVFLTFTQTATGSKVVIDGNTFPGTYYVTGDTYARSDVDGRDQFFQFIIPKAKMNAENTITLEAEGDPSVFNMSLKVLRPDNGEMMQLVQYDLSAPAQG